MSQIGSLIYGITHVLVSRVARVAATDQSRRRDVSASEIGPLQMGVATNSAC